MKNYDLIIIGSGPAGLTAALYAARYKVNALVVGKLLGGTATKAYKVCNFPAFKGISGFELISKMIEQVKSLDVEIKQEDILGISGKDNDFKIKTNKTEYSAKKILIATGSDKRRLNLEKEDEFVGKGVNYCATCDAGFYKDKVVCVVGGGNAALTSALLLTKFAKQVYIIYRRESFINAEPAWADEVAKNPKIKILFETNITELIGEEKLEKIKLDNEKELSVDGVFVEIGNTPGTKLAEMLKIKLDGKNIAVNKNQATNIKGIFAAGDVTNNPLKQIITACAEGAVAVNSIYKELR